MHKWLILLSLFGTAATAAPAYTWVDENGQVHYSDRPGPGAVEVRLQGAQGFNGLQSPRPASAASESAAQARDTPSQAYTAFNVLSPAQQETLWNIGGSLDVHLELTPGLRAGHHLGVFLDGELLDLNVTGLRFQVPNVFRGVHTLQAVVLDTNGEEVLRSLAVTFMVQQSSILNPNNPNAPAGAGGASSPAANPGG